ncbi:putative DNA polymerase [Rosellinia necatrix]|uniref:DNA polymerase n=1 Tax=Rosellinia necatrix TaxID=77044 RepID=A0A1W2TLP4_ROSNE|nr:putative DNA polymerase [Rosellinia necatrix]
MSKAVSRRTKLAELRALRASGKKAYDTYEVAEEQALYEEVDEGEYKKIVRERLNQDDFVVDDNGEGYADDGREDWDRVQTYYSESDGETPSGSKDRKSDKRKREQDTAKRDANDRDISEFFMKGRAAPQPKAKVVKTEDDDRFLANLLGEVDANVQGPAIRLPKRPRSSERRRVRASSPLRNAPQPAPKKAKLSQNSLPPTAHPAEGVLDDKPLPLMGDDMLPQLDDDIMSDLIPVPSSPISKAIARKAQLKTEAADEDEDEEMMEVVHAGAINTKSVNLSASRPIKKLAKPEPYPSPVTSSPSKTTAVDVDSSSWNQLTDKLNVVSSSAAQARPVGKMDYREAIEEDGSLNMFWTDYTEVNGSLCLFGKVQNKKTGVYSSCFVKVDNIQRKLYFLPRLDGQDMSDDEVMKEVMQGVHSEVDEIMTKMNVERYKDKSCHRKYAFELPGIPREATYLKLLYPYTKPQIDASMTGNTFSRVFGTNTALFEQFVLWKNIMGPCWLKIQHADFATLKNGSYAKLEAVVSDPDAICPLNDSDNLDAPPLTIMSLAMRTTFNPRANKAEIFSISARIYQDVLLSDPTPAAKLTSRTFTIIRPDGAAFPFGFEKLAQDREKGLIKLMKTEADILSFFLGQIDFADPDVLLGHQLEGVDYSILLNRLHEKKTPQWARLGRLRRTQWPPSIGKAGGNVFAERQVMAGRLLCDLANDAGKSVMYKCQSWSLTEMCDLYLGDDIRRMDVDNEVALKTWASEKNGLMDYISHMEADTYYIAALALRTQILPLTKVLTNLAGNSWARTLTGTRAERNEYILLHEFHRNKYICPDKQFFKGRPKVGDEADEEDATASKKKDKYKGGLVFPPDKGLYDKFVLVMDFNSLYPSIIQEFNICFTTVKRSGLSEDEDEVPQVPEVQEQGVLPRLIATLVSRRRQVKSLMKDKNATPEQLATWDIKQLALKLTANSMYGCLGYTKSRFYARPLAVLTTSKGREILCSTKALAESKSLHVIYGDTDSVMINANVDSVADALKVGNDFKKAVNERYRLLEIDIDNVFRRILLQAKKKYAAINLVEVPGGKFVDKLEVKGLDMKRREYCNLSKEISSRILNDILSGDETEIAVQRIHEYLREISGKMREHLIPVQKYIIYTQLGKAPTEYPNADSMPQVQVALREIARGKNVRRGDVISYVVTGDSKTSSEHVAKRAYTPQDLIKKDTDLKVDVEWYIGKQIFPPVERLCANITGTSTSQLAEHLGLDLRRYANNSSNPSGSNDLEIHPMESQIADEIRFAGCTRLSLRCRKCKVSSPFVGLLSSLFSTETGPTMVVTAQGVSCPSCSSILPNLTAVAQLEHAVRAETSRYYEGWLVCSDTSCGNRTRQLSVYGTRCMGPQGHATGCRGTMRYEYSERDIYNQLVYFASLWDVDKARAKAQSGATGLGGEGNAGALSAAEQERIKALAEHNRARFSTIKGVVDKYLDKCGRQWVAMDTLFSKVGLVAT